MKYLVTVTQLEGGAVIPILVSFSKARASNLCTVRPPDGFEFIHGCHPVKGREGTKHYQFSKKFELPTKAPPPQTKPLRAGRT